MGDWSHTIDAIRRILLDLASMAHPRRNEQLAPPSGASLRAISAVERRIGCRLPPSYRAFLHLHDGFPGLLHGAALFGTRDLGRSDDAALTRAVFAAYETPIPEVGPRARPEGRGDAMIPFGMDADGATIFAWNPAVVRADGEMEVIVWVNGLGDRCDDFPSFLVLVRDMLQAEALHQRLSLRLTG